MKDRPIDLDGSEAFFSTSGRQTASFGSEYGSRAGNANVAQKVATTSDIDDEPIDLDIELDRALKGSGCSAADSLELVVTARVLSPSSRCH